LSTRFPQLESIKAKHRKFEQAIDALADYISGLRSRGQNEVEPYLASRALGTTEAFTLGLLNLLEDGGLVTHSYNIYCGKQGALLASVADKREIPSAINCKYCDTQHCKPDDFEVELVFKPVDSVWPYLSHNVAAR
jgi:hypothetical protein